MHSLSTKKKVIELRKDGYSYNYIRESIPVSKSTLNEWLKDVPFTPNTHTIARINNAKLSSAKYQYKVKIESFNKANTEAKNKIRSISKRDIMMLGLGIYIGEGSKTEDLTRIINSDSRIIKFTLKWLRVSFGVQIKNIKVRLYIYPDNNESQCIKYWSRETGIPTDQFFSSVIDRRTNKKLSNNGKLPFGTAHISVVSNGNKKHGVYLSRLILALINRVLC